ncbi:CBS domain-containing protein [Maricaulis sp. CAU 1757]
MNVETILRQKGRDVVCINEDASLGDAVRLLDAHGIGALVIRDGQDREVGVLAERDILRELALGGAGVLERPVSQVPARAFVTAGRDTGLDDLMVLMTERRVRQVPILEDGNMVGLVSIGDVVKAKIADMEAETAALQAYISS